MENLANSKMYTPEATAKIESMGAAAVAIANRWMLGWPHRVDALLNAGTYIESLEYQLDQEKDILANEANLRHLSRREILEMYGTRESPPALE